MRGADGTNRPVEELIPLLLKVQNNLDEDVNLDSLAAAAGYSRYHFHRLFRSAIGETPRAYIERLRMEKAAYKLWITDNSVLDIALSVGFRSHETFCRAFRRHFSVTPTQLREEGRIPKQKTTVDSRWDPGNCMLSPVRFQTLRAMGLLSIRHIGGYDTIPEPFAENDHLWRKIGHWAKERRIRYYPAAVCIYYDNPWLTPVESQRSDACLPIAGPIQGWRPIRSITIEPGEYGGIEHTGPRSTRWQAFRKLADTIHSSERFTVPGEPPGAISIKPLDAGPVDRLEVYLKVVRRK